MQTFLPFPRYRESAAALDRQRLGKQRVEAWQILGALEGRTNGWSNHPAARMWRGYERALCLYGLAVCDEWIRRGYRDTMRERFASALQCHAGAARPAWLGDEDFHRSHQSNLLRKAPEHYGPMFPGVPADLPYVWPTGLDSLGALR